MNHGNSITYTRRHAISLTNALYKDISVFHKWLFESRQEHNAFLTLCPRECTAFLWGSSSGYSGHSACVSTASSHICTRPSRFFYLTQLLQNALSSKTLVFLSCLHLNISVIHPTMLLPNHVSLSLQSYSGHRTRDCFAVSVRDKRLKWSSILWIIRTILQKSPGLGWFAPMRICAVSFVYLQNVPCTTN